MNTDRELRRRHLHPALNAAIVGLMAAPSSTLSPPELGPTYPSTGVDPSSKGLFRPRALRQGVSAVLPKRVRLLRPRWRRMWARKAEKYGPAMAWRIVRRRQKGGRR